MATEPQLIVALEARLDKFEKAMVEAGVIAEKQVQAIEAKFGRMDITPGRLTGAVAAGTVIARVLEKAFEGFVSQITQAVEEMDSLNAAITKTTLTAEQLQRVGFAARAGGVSDKEFFAGINAAAARLDEMNRTTTTLSEALDRNNIKYRDQAGLVVNVDKGLELAAELMSRAGSELEKIQIAKMFGLTEQWVRVLGDGVQKFREMKEAARIDENLARSLQHMEALRTLAAQIRAQIGGWGTDLVQHVLPNLVVIVEFFNSMVQHLRLLAEEEGVAVGPARALAEQWERFAKAVRDAAKAATGPLRITVNKPSGVIQPERAADRDALTRFDEQLSKHIELLKAEGEAIGKGVAAQEAARQTALLTEAAKRAGLPVEQALNAERQKEIALSAQLKEANIARAAAFNELVASSKEFGSALSEAFKGMVLEGKKLDEVLRNLANRMASRAIDKLFDLFFAAPSTGGPSAFLKLLGIGVPGRQHGGPVTAGNPFLVGEKGPELFVPNRAGIVVPNTIARRSAGGMVNVNINLAGANGDQTIRQIAFDATAQGMALALRQVPRIAVDAVANQQVRFA